MIKRLKTRDLKQNVYITYSGVSGVSANNSMKIEKKSLEINIQLY